MKILTVKCLKDNYSYIVFNEESLFAVVIDPSESEPVINEIKKNNLKLKYIFNTHHHYDHVGGNIKLKEKYRCKVIGYEKDKDRIPEIDIGLKDNQKWKNELFECEILHVPGHTAGHICIYIEKINALFTGDTLFSLGCGRIFEGTYTEMFNSLNKMKKFPKKTKIYCGHEYTKKNSDFCLSIDTNNSKLRHKIDKIKNDIKLDKPTIPSTLEDELECNIFLRADNLEIQKQLGINSSDPIETFTKLRELKDNF
ncbi:hydroxyacylglutathione hydrolase [Candidatus Pelagibacter sp.]|nr:hydroxyacylglutathione hydrolase [Candidatus Pelagibacter sp.]